MQQLEPFDGDLIHIRHYLTCWSEAERTKRLADVKNPRRVNAGGKPPCDGGRK
jgi:hypothetical protein